MQRRPFISYAAAAFAAPTMMYNALAQDSGGISTKSITIGCSAALSDPLAGVELIYVQVQKVPMYVPAYMDVSYA